jgi:hypothetical protein
MVGLIRDTCPAFKRDQRIRPKINIISVFPVCSSDPEGAGEIKKLTLPLQKAGRVSVDAMTI